MHVLTFTSPLEETSGTVGINAFDDEVEVGTNGWSEDDEEDDEEGYKLIGAGAGLDELIGTMGTRGTGTAPFG